MMIAFGNDIKCVCIKPEAQITRNPLLSHFPHLSRYIARYFRLYYKTSERKSKCWAEQNRESGPRTLEGCEGVAGGGYDIRYNHQ